MDDIKLSNFNSKSKDEVVFTEDRIALVSGGTRGIGRGICEILKRAGATVIAGYASDDEQAKQVKMTARGAPKSARLPRARRS